MREHEMNPERAQEPAFLPSRGGRPALNLHGQRFGTLEAVRPDHDPKGAWG